MFLLACPSCKRQYDATGLPVGSQVRCFCQEVILVDWPPTLTGRALVCTHCGGAVGVHEEVCSFCSAKISEEDRRKTTLCPACFTRIDDDSKHCRSCALEINPQALTPLPVDRDCPRCEGGLRVRSLGVADVIECGECQGIWLTPKVFERVCDQAHRAGLDTNLGFIDAAGRAERKLEPVKYIPCMTCGELMQRRQYRAGDRSSHVVIDLCRKHGIWLDNEELEKIVSFLQAGGGTAAATVPANPEAFGSTSRGLGGAFPRNMGEREPPATKALLWVVNLLSDLLSWRL